MKLLQSDTDYVVAKLPADIREMMHAQPLYLGGGFIREAISRGNINDIDLFGRSKDFLSTCAYKLKGSRNGGRLHETDNAITLFSGTRLPVQFITRWTYDDPQKVADSFDFTVCQAVIWYNNGGWDSYTHQNFYPDLAAKRLVYTFPVRQEEAGGSMLRVRKFLQRGYNIQVNSLAGVITRLARAVNYEKAQDEESVSQIISGLLREVDPLVTIDDDSEGRSIAVE